MIFTACIRQGPAYETLLMTTINTQFRNFKEPSRDQLLRIFLSIPTDDIKSRDAPTEELEKVEINAVCPKAYLSACREVYL